jgi:integrase
MAQIRKHGKKWQAVVRRKKITAYRSFWKKSDCTKWAYQTEAQIETGSYLNVKKEERLSEIRLSELLNIFFDKTKSKSKNLKRFEYEINHLKRFDIANLYLSQLEPKILADFRDERLAEGKASSTVNKYLGLISRAINKGRREMDIPVNFNPVSLVEKPKERKSIDKTLDNEEWERLLEHASKTNFEVSGKLKNQYMKEARLTKYPNRKRRPLHFMRQIIIFARESLMRQAEIFNLRQKDVDFFNGTALVRETKNDTPRRIGLSPLAMKQLKSLPTSIDGRFFPIKSRHQFDNYFRLVVRDAKVNFNFHQLRHMGANDLIKSGWSIAEVQAQGGWKTLKALQRYLHIQAEHLANKMKKRGQ